MSAAKGMDVSAYQVGQVVHAVAARYESKVTTPPPRYTMATILDDMLAAWKFAKSDGDRAVLRQVEGLGTARTRQPMIDNAVSRGLLVCTKKGKNHELVSSPMARQVMAVLSPQLKDVAQTAKWEMAFGMIEKGEVSVEQAIDKAYQFIAVVVEQARAQVGKVQFQVPSYDGPSSGSKRR